MDTEERDRRREAARRRSHCPNCGNSSIEERDGGAIGGLPGINYRYCNGCGWSRAKTKRPAKFKL